jgi:SAM-dependent methyltransferase
MNTRKKQKLSPSVFETYSRYYDLLYKDKDYNAESQYINNLLKQFNIRGKRILELGSGTGKHANILTRYGYEIVGVERSVEMVSKAKQDKKFKCVIGDITEIALNKKFDAVLSLFHVVSYLTTNESLKALFKNTYDHLIKNGLFIFDVWYSPSVIFNQPEVRVKKIADKEIEIMRIAEPEIFENLNEVKVNYTIYTTNKETKAIDKIEETHSMRHFSIPELTFYANQHGFIVLHTEEFLTKNTPSQNTWGVCFVLRKAN